MEAVHQNWKAACVFCCNMPPALLAQRLGCLWLWRATAVTRVVDGIAHVRVGREINPRRRTFCRHAFRGFPLFTSPALCLWAIADPSFCLVLRKGAIISLTADEVHYLPYCRQGTLSPLLQTRYIISLIARRIHKRSFFFLCLKMWRCMQQVWIIQTLKSTEQKFSERTLTFNFGRSWRAAVTLTLWGHGHQT